MHPRRYNLSVSITNFLNLLSYSTVRYVTQAARSMKRDHDIPSVCTFTLTVNNNVMYIFISEEWKVVKIQPTKRISALFKNHPCSSHYHLLSSVIGISSSQNTRPCSPYYAIKTIHMHGYLRGTTNIFFTHYY
jgi:hypothetical protein